MNVQQSADMGADRITDLVCYPNRKPAQTEKYACTLSFSLLYTTGIRTRTSFHVEKLGYAFNQRLS